MRSVLTPLLVVFLAVGFAGCGGSSSEGPAVNPGGALSNAPDWVIAGRGDDPNTIYGLGVAEGSRNIAMLRTTAMARGRTEISSALEVEVQAMVKDYMSTATGGEEFGERANDEQYIESVSRNVTDSVLNGTRQDKLWQDEQGRLYILMAVDAEDFKNAIDSMGQLSESLRRAIKERSDRAFAELDERTDG